MNDRAANVMTFREEYLLFNWVKERAQELGDKLHTATQWAQIAEEALNQRVTRANIEYACDATEIKLREPHEENTRPTGMAAAWKVINELREWIDQQNKQIEALQIQVAKQDATEDILELRERLKTNIDHLTAAVNKMAKKVGDIEAVIA